MATTPANSYSNTFRAVGITFDNILTADAAMRACIERARVAAAGDVTVLILGETGTGKNLIAQAIHNASARIEGPCVSTNCSALPDTLLESELFGHEKGAFTSAERRRAGCFERANNGTLFLDEIGDMSPAAQAKVLHAIEYKQFARVGGDELLKSDVRIIAATNRQLRQDITTGRFRADLYYRLAEITIDIPPLRLRKGDIQVYAEAFIREAADKYDRKPPRISRQATARLREHDWPGNVRELRAVIRSAVMLCKGRTLDVADLALEVVHVPAATGPAPVAPVADVPAPPPVVVPAAVDDEPLDLESVERAHIERVLAISGWVKTEAARLLGVSRPTLDRKIAQYGLSK
ncbi:MAG: sigma-54 interaction domain-containing protein [Planctomycetota bacterium]